VKIGIVPVGYFDGFGVEKTRDTFRFIDIIRYLYHDIRSCKKRLYVRIKGQNARILGRINMFNIVVDLTGIEAGTGDEVTLDVNPLFVNPYVEREYI